MIALSSGNCDSTILRNEEEPLQQVVQELYYLLISILFRFYVKPYQC
jgi:hypothetical protein